MLFKPRSKNSFYFCSVKMVCSFQIVSNPFRWGRFHGIKCLSHDILPAFSPKMAWCTRCIIQTQGDRKNMCSSAVFSSLSSPQSPQWSHYLKVMIALLNMCMEVGILGGQSSLNLHYGIGIPPGGKGCSFSSFPI